MLRRFFVVFALLAICYTAGAQDLRAPAYPLVTHNPYLSIWSMGNELNGLPTKHWTGDDHSITGIIKIDNQYFRIIGEEAKQFETVLPTADEKSYKVKYTEEEPANDWLKADFKDEAWKSGAAPFSDNESLAKTLWKSKNLWVRRSFDMPSGDFKKLYLKLRHDDNIKVYINGEKIYDVEGWKDQYKFIAIEDQVAKKLKKKGNVLAIHIENTAGGAWLDAGIVKETDAMAKIDIQKAKQTGVDLHATRTVYHFDCGAAKVDVTFTSPALLDDLELLSRPVSYVSVKTNFSDNSKHDVKYYFGVGSNLAVHTPAQEVETWKYSESNLAIMKAGTVEQPILKRKGDGVRIDWGYAYVATEAGANTSQYITPAGSAILPFVNGKNPGTEGGQSGKSMVMSTITDLGSVKGETKEQVYLIGYDELQSVQLFDQKLTPWWKKNYESMEGLLAQSMKDYKQVSERCEAFDSQLDKDAVAAGGEKYAELCNLAYRQAIAAHSLLENKEGDLLFMSKENHSNGSINTVDITYPSSPLFLIYNPDLVKGMMNGIFYYSESGRWKKPFPAHDLGTYPIATGQTYGEDMPVEEAGNMLTLAAAIAEMEGNADYAKSHWATLTTWAEYLMKSGFDPANQLSTDDFAGHLARNANLSIKAIMAIASYGKLAGMLGDKATEKKYMSAAKDFAKKWTKLANNGDHYTLAFEKKGTWSQKYNLVWDDMLDFHVFPESVHQKEIKYYLTQQRKYGLPLDSRKTYTKSDWVMWTASMADNEEDFKALINPMWDYANETQDRVPVSDWHETTDARVPNFKARSVVGGYFMKMLQWKLENKK